MTQTSSTLPEKPTLFPEGKHSEKLVSLKARIVELEQKIIRIKREEVAPHRKEKQKLEQERQELYNQIYTYNTTLESDKLADAQSEISSAKIYLANLAKQYPEHFLFALPELEAFETEVVKPYTEKKNALQKQYSSLGPQISKATAAMRQGEYKVQQLTYQLKNARVEYGELLGLFQREENTKQLAQRLKNLFETTPWGKAARDYQLEDILFMLAAWKEGKTGVLNANVMGSGKSAETMALIQGITQIFMEEKNRKPLVLWITDKKMRGNTFHEWKKWVPNEMRLVLDSPKKEMRAAQLQLAVQASLPVIANYEAMNTTPELLGIPWDIVVMDEVQRLKGGIQSNPTQVFENARRLVHGNGDSDHKPFFLPLSGTPMENKPEEMWCYLHLFDPEQFPSVKDFKWRYTKTDYDKETNTYKEKVNTDALLKILKTQAIRQDPERVRKSWVDKVRSHYLLEHYPETAQEYAKIKQQMVIEVQSDAKDNPNKKYSMANVLALSTRLRQFNLWPKSIKIKGSDGRLYTPVSDKSIKLDEAMEKIEELLNEGESILVWSAQFNEPLYELQRRLQSTPKAKVALMTGDTKNPELVQELFQQDELNVLLCNLKSVGRGFNLQKSNLWPGGARHAIFLDLWWNPKANEQAEDRIWRMNASQGVEIHILHCDNTVDAFIAAILEKKDAIFADLFGDEEKSKLTPDDVISIIEELM